MMIRNFIAIVAMLSMMVGCESFFDTASPATPTSGSTAASATGCCECPTTTATTPATSDEVGTVAAQPSDNTSGTAGTAVDNVPAPSDSAVPNTGGDNTVDSDEAGSGSFNTNDN